MVSAGNPAKKRGGGLAGRAAAKRSALGEREHGKGGKKVSPAKNAARGASRAKVTDGGPGPTNGVASNKPSKSAKKAAGDGENAQGELTMREQLEKLAAEESAGSGSESDGNQPGKEEEEEGDASLVKGTKKRPRSSANLLLNSINDSAGVSLTTVLEQALQSNDNRLLEICLRNSDKDLVAATVARLTPTRVLQFLARIVQKFEQKPARALQLLVWIRAVLDLHGNYLIDVPDLAESLSGLYQIVESRLGNFHQLVQLHGRVNFVLSQASRQTVSNQEENVDASSAALVIYDEQAEADMEESTSADESVNGDVRGQEEDDKESCNEDADDNEDDDDDEEKEEEETEDDDDEEEQVVEKATEKDVKPSRYSKRRVQQANGSSKRQKRSSPKVATRKSTRSRS